MATFSVTENYGTYQGNTSYILDGSTSQTWRANATNSAGKYVLVEASERIHVSSVTYSTGQSSEIFKSGTYLQYSDDGSVWTDVGQFNGSQPQTFTVNADCKYLRIYCKSGSGYVSISELAIDYTEIGSGGGDAGDGEAKDVFLVPSAISSDHAYYGESGSYPLSNIIGKSSSAGTQYGGFNLTRNSNADSYIFIEFDASAIPANAIIKSVTATARVYGSTTSQSRTQKREIQLYSGNTAKGSATSYDMTGQATVFEITDGGSWTRAELDNLRMRVYAKRNTSGTTSNTYIYLLGADVTVSYELPGGNTVTLCVKVGGVWRKAGKVYRKDKGQWTEVTDIQSLFDGAENDTWSGFFAQANG